MNHPPHWPIGGGLDCDVMGFCEIVTEQENAGTVRTGKSGGSEAVSGLGEKCLLDGTPGPTLVTRVGVVG